MTPEQAAERLKPFNLEEMPAEDRHHSEFVLKVADALGVPHTPFNIQQVDAALRAANIHEDVHTYPKMLFSRKHQDEVKVGTYDHRHKYYRVEVDSEDAEKELGADWHDKVKDLPAAPVDGDV